MDTMSSVCGQSEAIIDSYIGKQHNGIDVMRPTVKRAKLS